MPLAEGGSQAWSGWRREFVRSLLGTRLVGKQILLIDGAIKPCTMPKARRASHSVAEIVSVTLLVGSD